jgi:hypothetical protein
VNERLCIFGGMGKIKGGIDNGELKNTDIKE